MTEFRTEPQNAATIASHLLIRASRTHDRVVVPTYRRMMTQSRVGKTERKERARELFWASRGHLAISTML